jgi:hypothetical protein
MDNNVRSEITHYIDMYKDTDEIHKAFYDFNHGWLKGMNNNLVSSVNINFDCVRNERIFGDGEYTTMVLGDFINSLEELLNNC